MANFDVVLATELRCPVIRVAGELDIATAPQLERVLQEAESPGDPLVIDLTGTTFCDSTGMTVMLRAHQRAGEAERGLVVVCPSDNYEVTRVLNLLGFDRVLRLHQSVEGAVAELCGDGTAEAPAEGAER